MLRTVEGCPYRSNPKAREGREVAACGLVERAFEGVGGERAVPREACEQCCLTEPYRDDQPNDVVASLLYGFAGRALLAGGLSEAAQARVEEVRRRAEADLAWVGDDPPGVEVRSTKRLIDASVNPDRFAEHLRRREPFAYLRYGDGEWISIFGWPGRNSDQCDHFPGTMGRELRGTLDLFAGLWPRNERVYVGLHTWLYQAEICGYLTRAPFTRRLHWVSDNLFSEGLRDLSTRRFLEAARDYRGRKLFVGNDTHAAIARALGCRHVPIPRRDCYLVLDKVRRRCRFRGPGLVLSCAGMATECLFGRLYPENPDGTYIDCGHIFDALVGRFSRDYTRENHDDIMAVYAEHYRPLFIP
ncbi:MAG TPA: hypothetical protein VGH33_18890 [Isosphaeraceae bacterium]|jgi:hypothetical protein